MRYFVFWNLHDKLFTVQNPLTGQNRQHTERLVLRDAAFEVKQDEREKMLTSGRKNLHAGVWGERVDLEATNVEEWTRVFYDPFVNDSFVDEDGKTVVEAQLVLMEVKDGHAHVWAKGVSRKVEESR